VPSFARDWPSARPAAANPPWSTTATK